METSAWFAPMPHRIRNRGHPMLGKRRLDEPLQSDVEQSAGAELPWSSITCLGSRLGSWPESCAKNKRLLATNEVDDG